MPQRQTTLVLGNGFSIGLIQSLGLEVDLSLSTLYPPPEWLKDLPIPVGGTSLKKCLCDPSRYPELHAILQDSIIDGRHLDLYQIGLRLQANRAFDTADGITFHNRHPGLQLRFYLWHLFNQYDQFLNKTKRHIDSKRFPFAELLFLLISRGPLVVVSYNYECFIEDLIASLGVDPQVAIRGCNQAYQRLRELQFAVLVLKPHGSIAFGRSGIPGGTEGAGLMVVIGQRITGNDDVYLRRPRTCPSFPDLVPPGHSDEHYLHTETDVREAVGRALADSDLVIDWGFSATNPDAEEFERYARRISPNAKVFCSALSRAQPPAAYQILQRHTCEVELVDPNIPSNLLHHIRQELR